MDANNENIWYDILSGFDIDTASFDDLFSNTHSSTQQTTSQLNQHIQTSKAQQTNIKMIKEIQQNQYQPNYTTTPPNTHVIPAIQYSYPYINYQNQLNPTPKPSRHKCIFTIRDTRPIKLNKNEKPQPGSEDELFEQLLKDRRFTINPKKLNFIPNGFWPDCEIPFGDIVADFFQRKNNPYSRFHMKLYNALKLTEQRPDLKNLSGVEWVSPTIFIVNKARFARLLGINSINGSLFHKQGNFPTHGFCVPSQQYIIQQIGEKKYDETDSQECVFLFHKNGIFTQHCSEYDLLKCKWGSPNQTSSKIQCFDK